MLTALSLFFLASAQANVLQGIRVWPSPDETRVVIDVAEEVSFSYFSLSSPNRLVVDLKQTQSKAPLPMNVSDSPVLSKVRASTPPEKGTYRLVLELKTASDAQLFKLAPTPGGRYGHRLVIDLNHPSGASKQTQPVAKAPSATKSSASVSQPQPVKMPKARDILIAIDPGHGGEDPGSIGPTRKYEKTAVLSISQKLAQKLDAIPGITTKLTRRGDYFVNLNRRVAIAREADAHLLVSIHADAFTSPQPRGGSVFVLNTRRANTEIARWVENHEKQSELLGGSGTAFAGNINDRNVNQTLLDLQFSHSQKEGYKLATSILSEMGKVTKLHNNKPINTSLAVLRSPQIPSVLVETGFISNPTEERLLFQRDHQDKLVNALTKAIVQYLKENPPEGTGLAQVKPIWHKVVRGDALSLIAKRYGTSTQAIMKANNLTSSGLAIGQLLKIPNATSASSAPASAAHSATKTLVHTVASGEFLGKIATRYGVSVAAIKQQNNLRSDTLRVGQKLTLTVNVADLPLRRHKVTRGEYLGKIAAKYGVTVEAIRRENKLRSDELAVGQILNIPH
ncbi:N-acetylmuramoyl-L-alanine amidase [Vibrio agarilyticus]